ncbi:MAG: hypothetical protein KF819_14035 [Labilithrix sp.]|nr:hypothetical protein [Labilithrix sp.]
MCGAPQGLSPSVQVGIAVVAAALFVGTLLAIPVVVVRMPADYLVRPPPKRSFVVRAARLVAAVTLIVLGVLMLVLPGQGILTILVGLGILDLPIKRRLLRKLLSMPRVRAATNQLRARRGKPPLLTPDEEPLPA